MGRRIGVVIGILLACVALAGAQPPATKPAVPGMSLLDALCRGDVSEVKRNLAADPTLAVTRIKHNYCYPIDFAIQNEGTAVLELLLAAGADVNTHNGEGNRPLHNAALFGNVDAGRLLLAKGAVIDARNHHGVTALLMAAESGKEKFVDMLLAKGASVTSKDRDGSSMLLLAAYSRSFPTILRALNAGGDVKAVNENGETVLHAVLAHLKNADIGYGRPPEYGDPKNAAAIYAMELEKLPEADHETVLAQIDPAAKDLLTALVSFFVKRGANVNAVDEAGRTPLLDAAQTGNLDTVKFLLDHGAKMDVTGDDGMTPAWAAASSGNAEVLTLLAEKGCPLNVALDDGSTTLHAAARAHSAAMATLLLAKGADPQALDDAEETPLFDAVHESKWGAYDDPDACRLITVLLDHGGKVNARNNRGDTPLHMAVAESHLGIIPLLVAKGARLDAKNNAGQTPLQLIDHMGDLNTRKLLLKAVGKG